MAIDLRTLNTTEVILPTRTEVKPVSYRLDTAKLKENWEEIKNDSKNLMQISPVVSVAIEGLKSSGEVKHSGCNYSVEAFFRKDMPLVTTNGGYMVGGENFTKEELEQCRMVMKAAVGGIGCGIGKNTNIDYRNYAEMGIAVSSVKAYADENLTKEQAAVVNRAMQEYNEALIGMEEEMLSGDNYRNSNYGVLSEYYGKEMVLNDAEIASLNESLYKLRKELGQVTGEPFKTVQKGAAAVVGSATNQKLISELLELFSNTDIKDEKSVNAAMERYKVLVSPAYKAYGVSTNILNKDISDFRKQIANSLLASKYHAADYSV